MLAVSSQVVGQGLLVYALGHLEPVVAGLCLLVQPVISATVGWIVYGERLGPVEFMVAAMIRTALVLIRRPNRTVPPPPPIGSARITSPVNTYAGIHNPSWPTPIPVHVRHHIPPPLHPK